MATGEPNPKKARTESDTSKGLSTDNPAVIIQQHYNLKMSEDFYDFWEFTKQVDEAEPGKVWDRFGFRLCGPFDALLGKKGDSPDAYILHSRFYYDIPEFLTVIISEGNTNYHIGYFWDNPNAPPAFLASNEGTKDCKLTIVGDNIFSVVVTLLEAKKRPKIREMIKRLKYTMGQKGYEMGRKTEKIKTREKKVVSRGFHGAGIVVPVDGNGVGWREIPHTVGELKKIFAAVESGDEKAADELQELITYVQFANDECDYGQGLELGQDLFCYGHESLHSYIRTLLPMAYSLLGYTQFSDIIQAHLKNRRRDNPVYLS